MMARVQLSRLRQEQRVLIRQKLQVPNDERFFTSTSLRGGYDHEEINSLSHIDAWSRKHPRSWAIERPELNAIFGRIEGDP